MSWEADMLRCCHCLRGVQDRAFNDRRYYIGSSKLGSLGWQERTSWEEGLRRTIDW
jgi:UDP-glucose 4,6-dehydratase